MATLGCGHIHLAVAQLKPEMDDPKAVRETAMGPGNACYLT